MEIVAVLASILVLVLLIAWGKLHPFIAFLLASILAGVLLGIPVQKIPAALEKGIGNLLGSLAIILCVGAMFGKLISESGAAQKIATVLMRLFGERYIPWALMFTGFIVGIPLFYNVGFVLLVPLIFSVAYQFRLPAVAIGMPLLASLSVTHGFLPPHPSPTALVAQFNADIGLTLIYGLIVALPTMILAGPVFARTLRKIEARPLETFKPPELTEAQLPGAFNSFFTALLPVLMLAATAMLPFIAGESSSLAGALAFFGNPNIVMLLALLIACWTLAIGRQMPMKKLMEIFSSALKDISVILLIIAGAGALKQIFVDSGVSNSIAGALEGMDLNPLLSAWLIASIIRVCLGSATVAGLTTAAIVAPLTTTTDVNPNLLVLAVGAGSLMFSHVNDSGFWMAKEYFNLSLKDTVRSWSLMESVVAVAGIVFVLLLDLVV